MLRYLTLALAPLLASQIHYREVSLETLVRRSGAVVVATALAGGTLAVNEGKRFHVVRRLGGHDASLAAAGTVLAVRQGGAAAMQHVRAAYEARGEMESPLLDRYAGADAIDKLEKDRSYVLLLHSFGEKEAELVAENAILPQTAEAVVAKLLVN